MSHVVDISLVLLITFEMTTSQGLGLPQYIRCYNNPMDKTLCDVGRFIQIRHAYYLDVGTGTSCSDASPPQNPCRADISKANPTYYDEIVRKCNGKRACSGLWAGKASTHCNSWFTETDLVMLEFTCDPETTLPTTTPVPTSTSTLRLTDSSSNSTQPATTPWETNGTITESNTVEPGVASRQSGVPSAVLIAVPIIVVLIITGVIILAIFFLRRRKKSQKPSNNGQAPTQQATYNNAIYANSDVIDGSTYPYDKAATVVIPSRKRDSSDDTNVQFYMDMSSPTNSTLAPLDTKNTDQQNERIYSLEKIPSPTENMYQSYESPYTEPTPKATRDGIQYIRMTGGSQSDQVGPYSEVSQPNKLEDVEGVYSVPRNSGKVVDANSLMSSFEETLDETRVAAPPPPAHAYENIYENPQKATGETSNNRQVVPPEAEYSEVSKPEAAPRGKQNVFSTSSDTLMVENDTYG